ncbi:hypothetical protein HYN69_10120 [Gemmobacter aquarius]|uniref:Uncharacterized protein n=1 Tax=Paragemmobacter aquarius TaxID=2169400 RepID=A0A2S0ULY9_9RHOB|nr:ACT domain-containing protein [Gemmobacter aquarius]AWB48816.1 hypothetical protein HYN69_10120 [Gemmobacter aquarius]
MDKLVRDGRDMVAGMSPQLTEGRFAFVDGPEELLAQAIGFFREAEGLSLIVPAGLAPNAMVMRCITLQVHSALDGVGMTAAVAGALARAGISCNMVAALRHDHVFIPETQAEAALAVLLALQRGAVTR